MDSEAQEPTEVRKQVWAEGKAVEYKRVYTIRTYSPDHHWTNVGNLEQCLVGLKDRTPRIRYPTTNSKVRYLTEATTELKHLTACVITKLVPVGIFADKLEEEYPDLKEAADHLREWERLAREAANSSYL